MYTVKFKIVGEEPLIMHADVLADPMHPLAVQFNDLTNLTRKTADTHRKLSELSFTSSCYTDIQDNTLDNSNSVITFPSYNVEACIAAAATTLSLKKSTKRAVTIESPNVDFQYSSASKSQEVDSANFRVPDIKAEGKDHPTTPNGLMNYPKKAYIDRRNVVIARNKVPRTRPVFPYWSMEVTDLKLDDSVISPEKLAKIIKLAGKFEGLGTYRPRFGKFRLAEFSATIDKDIEALAIEAEEKNETVTFN